MGDDLWCTWTGIDDAGTVADRQAGHLAAVDRYVADVCGRREAFRGLITPLGVPYAEALVAVTNGLMRGGEATRRWGDAARVTAADLAASDRLARRLLEQVERALPDWLPDLPDVPVPSRAALATGTAPAPAGCPVPVDMGGSPVPLDDLTGTTPDLPRLLGGGLGTTGSLLGQGLTAAKDAADVLDAARGIGEARADADATGDDLDRYADFVGADS